MLIKAPSSQIPNITLGLKSKAHKPVTSVLVFGLLFKAWKQQAEAMKFKQLLNLKLTLPVQRDEVPGSKV